MHRRKRILFVAEAVTLTHVIRPLVLARSLDSERYEVHFACAERFPFVFGDEPFRRWTIESIPTGQFLHALATGRRLFDYPTLAAYAEEERALFERVRPDLVVGDYRLSLAVSAPLAGVPYASINNAYWSPYARGRFPMPDMPMTRFLGVWLSSLIFRAFQPTALAWHIRPLNRLRREKGLAEFPDICTANTWGDQVLYADVPAFVPVFNPPGNHHYIGPVHWSTQAGRPGWWDEMPGDRPWLYVNFGSSGRENALQRVLEAISGLPVYIMIATAGREHPRDLPDNVRVADYLPGEEAAARSAVVICNGGSGTVSQAMNAGVPVLGMASNIDQYMVMRYAVEAGVGIGVRSDLVTNKELRTSIEMLLNDAKYRQAARMMSREFQQYDAIERFGNLVDQWLA
jgi:UDP:flavonoid glycosyltransferase YjiC (YdhE family)